MAIYPFGIGAPDQVRRRVFVSYHHGRDQRYYDAFSNLFGQTLQVFADRSLDRARDSNDPDYIMRYIRENHLTGASTLIVLCGLETPQRKFVDWEIAAGLRQGMALIGVKLPSLQVVDDGCAKPARLQDNIDSGYAVWTWWDSLTESVGSLTRLIEATNERPKDRIDNSRPRRSRNG